MAHSPVKASQDEEKPSQKCSSAQSKVPVLLGAPCVLRTCLPRLWSCFAVAAHFPVTPTAHQEEHKNAPNRIPLCSSLGALGQESESGMAKCFGA